MLMMQNVKVSESLIQCEKRPTEGGSEIKLLFRPGNQTKSESDFRNGKGKM